MIDVIDRINTIDMIDIIKDILSEEKIENYFITETKNDSAELFFIGHTLDIKRQKSVCKYEVTVYCDFEKDDVKMRGSCVAIIFSSMEKDEIRSKLKDAYYAASFVCNPYFELPSKAAESKEDTSSVLSSMTLEESALEAAKAIYSANIYSQEDIKDSESKSEADSNTEKPQGCTFINSSEIFSCRTRKRILGSNGTDVSYTKNTLEGEFVVQCTDVEDVEFYSHFEYDDLNCEALKEMAKNALDAVKARSHAKRSLKDGRYNIILDKENLGELLSFYLDRANAANIYAKYSDYSIGGAVQGEDAEGELLNIDVIPSAPYSSDGIPMEERKLIKNGRLCTIHGSTRFCRYLGIEPAGVYSKIKLSAGATSISDMKKEPYLHVIKFSDFSMDTLSGHFGGEIRLAYLFDGKGMHIITGGSINGLITDAQKNFEFSSEKYQSSSYEGPLAVKIRNINVAGC